MSALAKNVIGRGISHIPGRTHFLDVDVQDLREIRAVAAARIAELREELAVLEAELEVLDEALEENSPDGPARVEPASS